MMQNFGGSGPASYKEVTPAEAQAMLESGQAVLIDVREPGEYAQVHARGATLMPLGTVPQHLAEIPTDKDVLMICQSGGRSARACEAVSRTGHTRLFNVKGGTAAWVAAKLPTER